MSDIQPALLEELGEAEYRVFCGVCADELEDVDADGGHCNRCGLYWPLNPSGHPELADEDAEPCGYHDDECDSSLSRYEVEHRACPLPKDHASGYHPFVCRIGTLKAAQ